MVGSSFTILDETPCADPHAGCCGEGWLDIGPYPIRTFSLPEAEKPFIHSGLSTALPPGVFQYTIRYPFLILQTNAEKYEYDPW